MKHSDPASGQAREAGDRHSSCHQPLPRPAPRPQEPGPGTAQAGEHLHTPHGLRTARASPGRQMCSSSPAAMGTSAWSFGDLFTSDSSAPGWKCPGLLSGSFICLGWQRKPVGSPPQLPSVPNSFCSPLRCYRAEGWRCACLPTCRSFQWGGPRGRSWSCSGRGSIYGVRGTGSPFVTADLFQITRKSDCSGLKGCLCCFLDVWPQQMA